jgi:DnaJ-class molecular chaperone
MDVDIIFDSERYGYDVCPHCNGHGVSLRDPAEGDTCILCGGLGLLKRDIEKGA